MKVVAAVVIATVVSGMIVLFLSAWSSLEYTEIGLDYNAITRSIDEQPYAPGRYYLGVGHTFLKFPSTVQNVQFSHMGENKRGKYDDDDDDDDQIKDVKTITGPLKSRTKDGLEIEIELSFQYQLIPEKLYSLYMTYGRKFHSVFIRGATDVLTAVATEHAAKEFFADRAAITKNMEEQLKKYFATRGFIGIPLFQFQAVDLPGDSAAFEQAIKDTQVADQKIKRVQAEQTAAIVTFETRVMQAKKQVLVINQQAEAYAETIELQNKAYCVQFKAMQEQAASAFSELRKNFVEGKTADKSNEMANFIDYMKVRSIRDHQGTNIIGIKDTLVT